MRHTDCTAGLLLVSGSCVWAAGALLFSWFGQPYPGCQAAISVHEFDEEDEDSDYPDLVSYSDDEDEEWNAEEGNEDEEEEDAEEGEDGPLWIQIQVFLEVTSQNGWPSRFFPQITT